MIFRKTLTEARGKYCRTEPCISDFMKKVKTATLSNFRKINFGSFDKKFVVFDNNLCASVFSLNDDMVLLVSFQERRKENGNPTKLLTESLSEYLTRIFITKLFYHMFVM